MLQGLRRRLAPLATALTVPVVCSSQVLARSNAVTAVPPILSVPPAPAVPQLAADTPAVLMGVNTAGTVHVNNLANLEVILNLVANGGEVVGVAWGVFCIYQAIKNPAGRPGRVALGFFLITMGLSVPFMVNWLVAGARDCGGLF